MNGITSSYSVGSYTAGEGAVLWRGRSDTGTVARRGVHMHHGYNVLATAYLATYRYGPATFAQANLPVLTGDDGGLSVWGNDTCANTADSGATWLTAQPGVKTDKVIVYGGSMGCLDALNWIKLKNQQAKVAAVVLVLPAVDLQDLHDNRYLSTPGDLVAPIETAYGGSAAFTSALPTHNPASNASAFSSLPMLLCYSSDDPIAVPSVVTTFAAAVGSSATLLNFGAHGHSDAALDTDVVRAWCAPYL